MTPKNLKMLLNQTCKRMYGFNYAVTLGIELFERCFSLKDISSAIKETFTNSNPGAITPVLVSENDFWSDINENFDFRGDNTGTYLKLNAKQEAALKSKQSEIKKFISGYIQKDSQIYSYPFFEGIPGYPVYWRHCFVILNNDGKSLFFYGSSSD